MSELTISQAARLAGLRPSTIRYYEQEGILKPALRRSGQRRYSVAILNQLAVVRRAREAGFSLNEIRQLFLAFPESTPLSKRWRQLAAKKQAELDEKIAQIKLMKACLRQLETDCDCDTVNQCGASILGRRS